MELSREQTLMQFQVTEIRKEEWIMVALDSVSTDTQHYYCSKVSIVLWFNLLVCYKAMFYNAKGLFFFYCLMIWLHFHCDGIDSWDDVTINSSWDGMQIFKCMKRWWKHGKCLQKRSSASALIKKKTIVLFCFFFCMGWLMWNGNTDWHWLSIITCRVLTIEPKPLSVNYSSQLGGSRAAGWWCGWLVFASFL